MYRHLLLMSKHIIAYQRIFKCRSMFLGFANLHIAGYDCVSVSVCVIVGVCDEYICAHMHLYLCACMLWYV